MTRTLVHRVIARLNVGGPAMHVANLARGLDEGPWHTKLIAGAIADDEGDMAYYAEERGVEVCFLPELSREISFLHDLRALWALFRLFKADRPTVVHTHTAKAGTLGRLAAILAGVPVIVHTFHGHVLGGGYFSPLKTRFFLEVERQLARGTSRLVVLTERQAEEMSEELGVAERSKFTVIPLGLELERFSSVDREAVGMAVRESLGITADELVIGIVGRLVPIKNHELWLEAMAETVRVSDRPVRGMVVGAGERESELKELAASLGIADRILWLGWRRDLPELYAAMDVLALTSHDEGTPVAIIEAMSTGTPVVARDVGGVGEMVGKSGAAAVIPRSQPGTGWVSPLLALAAGSVPDTTARVDVTRRFSVGRLAGDVDTLYTALGARVEGPS